MGTAFVPRASAQAHRAGFLVVVGLHVGIGLALLHGLARTLMEPPPPPIVFTKPVDPVDAPPPEPPPLKPTIRSVFTPTPVPLPDDPVMQKQDPATTITTSPAPATGTGPSGSDTTGTAQPAPQPQPAPRAASRPVISNVQACAPTAEDYPVGARRAEAAGTTRIRFTVSAAGALVGSEVVRSAGPLREHKQLDRIAQTKLAGCTFGAGIDESGRTIGGTFEVDYVWRLDN